MFLSPVKGWEIAFEKYSPSTNIKHKPVVPICGRLAPIYNDDETTRILIWGLSASEEYYYQNCIELLSIERVNEERMKTIITTHRMPTYWPDRLVNFHYLGSGAFGTVFKAEDRIDKCVYAVKQVTTQHKEGKNRFLFNMLTIITEKSSYMRANNSPFVIRLYGAFQDESFEAYWLVFEYCIGDLQSYVDEIELNMFIFMDQFLERNIVTDIYNVYKSKMGLDIETIGFIYSFELLAGLSYLANRNLVHNDLKPENVLVSNKGHLKIADLGLAQRVKWFDRHSSVHMVQPDKLTKLDLYDKNITFCGNKKYTDPETTIHYNMIMDKEEIYKRIRHKDFPIKNGTQDFMTDLYGIGLIIMELIFGLNFITTYEISLGVAKDFDINILSEIELRLFEIRCIFDADVHTNYLMKILENQMTENNRSIIKFLMSCLKPKSVRGLGYTKEFKRLWLKNIITSKSIDIALVENIEYYKFRNITEYNVCSLELPNEFFAIYAKEPSQPVAVTFQQLQERLDEELEVKTGEREMKFGTFQLAL